MMFWILLIMVCAVSTGRISYGISVRIPFAETQMNCHDCGIELRPESIEASRYTLTAYGHAHCDACAAMFRAVDPTATSCVRYFYVKAIDSRLGPEKKMRVRQALVCGDCGAIIEDEHLPQEEDWTCPECECPSNLELTLVIGLETNDAR